MMIYLLRPLLCTRKAKWAERPPKVMKRSQKWNTLHIYPRRDSNSCGNVIICSSTRYQLDHGGKQLLHKCKLWLASIKKVNLNLKYGNYSILLEWQINSCIPQYPGFWNLLHRVSVYHSIRVTHSTTTPVGFAVPDSAIIARRMF